MEKEQGKKINKVNYSPLKRGACSGPSRCKVAIRHSVDMSSLGVSPSDRGIPRGAKLCSPSSPLGDKTREFPPA